MISPIKFYQSVPFKGQVINEENLDSLYNNLDKKHVDFIKNSLKDFKKKTPDDAKLTIERGSLKLTNDGGVDTYTFNYEPSSLAVASNFVTNKFKFFALGAINTINPYKIWINKIINIDKKKDSGFIKKLFNNVMDRFVD